MFYSKSLFIALSAVVASASVGYSDPQPLPSSGESQQVLSTQPDFMKAKLAVIIKNYQEDPSAPLSDQDVADLNDFARHSLEKSYNFLSKSDRDALSQIVNLNEDRFTPSLLDNFHSDQKLGAGMTTQDIDSLGSIVVVIRDGNPLSSRQVSDLKDFESMISENPNAFTRELPFLTQYVTLNTDRFSSLDLSVFMQASRDASGITATQRSLLLDIAGRNNQVLNLEDINVLQDLMKKAPLGSLNGFDPKVIIALNSTISSNSSHFSPNAVSSFGVAFDKNQVIRHQQNSQQRPVRREVRQLPPKSSKAPSSAAQRGHS